MLDEFLEIQNLSFIPENALRLSMTNPTHLDDGDFVAIWEGQRAGWPGRTPVTFPARRAHVSLQPRSTRRSGRPVVTLRMVGGLDD